ncbi:MAG: hypothetical protein IGS38_12275 [Synechococcales cyanobacterium M58_A2018_015]|nr:hypothetical protein [Synechococcales cyanobacterium M58_A2018_015]
MKRLTIAALSGFVGAVTVLGAEQAQAYYEDSWEFVCGWECGEALFEPEYGGYTVHGYAEVYHSDLPTSEGEAASWAYYDYWLPAGCDQYYSYSAQVVCLDTAYLHGLSAWEYFSSLYAHLPEEEMACRVIDERAYWRDPYAPYVEGWSNRDADLASVGNCWG